MPKTLKAFIGSVIAVVCVLTVAHAWTVLGYETTVASDVVIAANSDSVETFDIGTVYGNGYRVPDLIELSLQCSVAATAADSQIAFIIREYEGTRATDIGDTDSIRVVPPHKGTTDDWDGASILLRPTATTYQVTISNPMISAGKYAIKWRGMSQEK